MHFFKRENGETKKFFLVFIPDLKQIVYKKEDETFFFLIKIFSNNFKNKYIKDFIKKMKNEKLFFKIFEEGDNKNIETSCDLFGNLKEGGNKFGLYKYGRLSKITIIIFNCFIFL